jgi:transcriptional regulator of arginine metabolism
VRSNRRRDLIRILHEGRAASQLEIVAALRAAGHEVTQATVSRDLRELGALKVRGNGRFVYRLSDEVPRATHGDLVLRSVLETLEEFAVSIREAASVVVVATAPGHAAAVARAIDLADLPQVVGTVAGDDTTFVATTSERAARSLADTWRNTRSTEV